MTRDWISFAQVRYVQYERSFKSTQSDLATERNPVNNLHHILSRARCYDVLGDKLMMKVATGDHPLKLVHDYIVLLVSGRQHVPHILLRLDIQYPSISHIKFSSTILTLSSWRSD